MPTESVSQALRAWRYRRQLSCAEAGEILGISPRTLEGLEGGRPCTWPKLLLEHIRLLDKYGEPRQRNRAATG